MVLGGMVEDEVTELDTERVLSATPGSLHLVLQPLRRQWKPVDMVMMRLGLVASRSCWVWIFGFLVWRFYLFLLGFVQSVQDGWT